MLLPDPLYSLLTPTLFLLCLALLLSFSKQTHKMKIKKSKQKPIKLKIQNPPKCLQMQSKIKQATKKCYNILFCIGQLLRGKGCSPGVVGMPSGTLLKKTDFCFAYRYQLQIAAFSGVGGVLCTFLISVLGPLWLEPAQALCMLP